jgi:nucleotide-binding universal stress UspA family protein
MAAQQPSTTRRPYKILVPTDFSESSRTAIEYVIHMFGDQLSHLYLLNAYKEKFPEMAPMVSLVDILREKSERMMHLEMKFVATLPHHQDLQIVAVTRFETLLQAVMELVVAEAVDLVAIGTNGHMHPRLEFRDDDPSYVLHQIKLPILLVPKLLS